jgi:hypothetical protein
VPTHSPHHARGFDRVRCTTLEHLSATTTTPSTEIYIHSTTQHYSPTQDTLCPVHANAHSALPDLRGVARVDSAELASVPRSLAHVSEGVFVAQKHSKHWSVSARTVGFSPSIPGQNVHPCLQVFDSLSLAISVGVVSVDMGSGHLRTPIARLFQQAGSFDKTTTQHWVFSTQCMRATKLNLRL